MTAKEKFSIGRYVKLSVAGIHHFRMTPRRLNASTRGRVIGFGRDPHIVKIQRDDIKTAVAYHMDFWEAAPEQVDLPIETKLTPKT